MENQDGSPTMKDFQGTLVVSVFSSGGPPNDPGEGSLASQEEISLIHLDPLMEIPQAS